MLAGMGCSSSKKSTQKQNISINRAMKYLRIFVLGLVTKGLVFVYQNSQCISETIFSFKTTKSFNLKNTHKQKKPQWLYKQNLITSLILLTLSSYCNTRNRKAYSETELGKILLCATLSNNILLGEQGE